MIVVAVDIPPPLYPIAQEEQRIEFDPYATEAFGFRSLHDDLCQFTRESSTSNTPVRSVRTAAAIDSPWRVRTSASAIDRTLDVTPAAAEAPLDVPGQLAEIRRLTGYSWEQLAGLVGCTRQAAHKWMNGDPIADANRDRLARLHSVLRYFDRGSADENRAVLDMAVDGITVTELLRQQRFEAAKVAAGKGPGRQDAGWGRPTVPQPQLEDHWYSRLVLGEEAPANVTVRAKPQAIKRLQLRKG